jgi:hypothetical protein
MEEGKEERFGTKNSEMVKLFKLRFWKKDGPMGPPAYAFKCIMITLPRVCPPSLS